MVKDESESIDIALKLGFVKNSANIKVIDISKEYINSDRKKKGLNYGNLKPGKFIQIMDGYKFKHMENLFS